MRRRLLLFLLLLLLGCGSAHAASVSITAASGSAPGTAIQGWIADGVQHVFLPGCWDTKSVTLTIGDGGSYTLGSMAIVSGSPADLSGLVGQKLQLKDKAGKKKGTVLIHHGSDLPAMFITMDARAYTALNKDKTKTISQGSVLYQEADGSITYNGSLTQLKGRGNATYSSEYRKKPYQLKLSQKVSLSGMGKGKTWILLANATDTTLLRNQVTYQLARAMGLPYSVDCRQMELYVNGEYRGLYLLTEKIQISKSRVNITNLQKATNALLKEEPRTYARIEKDKAGTLAGICYFDLPAEAQDYTGGYLLVIEKPYRYHMSDGAGFEADGKLCVIIKEPTCASRLQVTYIGQLVADLQRALLSRDGISPNSHIRFSDMIDMPSFARKFLLELIVKNYDFRSGSQYMFKESDSRGGLIYAGPGWDYDLTFGAMATGAKSAYITRKAPNNIWYLLSTHERFMQLARQEYKATLLPLAQVLAGKADPAEGSDLMSIRAYAAAIRDSAAMNYARWSVGSVAKATSGHTGTSFADGIEKMVTFLLNRMTWMNTYF